MKLQVVTIENLSYMCSFCRAVVICFVDQLLFWIAVGKETIHKQPGKTTSVKITSKPLLTKANTLKKKGLKQSITAPHIRKEIGKQISLGFLFFSYNIERLHVSLLCRSRRQNKTLSWSSLSFSLVPTSAKKLLSSTTPSIEKELPSAAQHQLVRPTHVPCSQQSPVIREKLCEHVQTQMALITGQKSQSNNEIPTVTSFPTSDHG